MNNYYQYTPCPGTTGGVFYSNVGPAWTQPGPFINFVVSPDPGKVPAGGCYRIAIVQLANLPSVYVQIDWNTATALMAPTCEDCNNFPPTEPCLNCPPGYILQEGDCIQEQILPAVYTGGLLEVQAGARSSGYGSFGLRLYPDISSYTFPLYGNGVTVPGYTVRDNNGAGVVVPTLLGAWGSPLLSNLWGMYDTGSGCPATGSTGGRLNTVGVWTTPAAVNDYPPYDTPICFEFCVTIDTPKQYLIGIAGDNKVEISINGVQTVFLDAPNGNITVPFFYWHVFPYTFTTPGEYTIKVCGINLQNLTPDPQPTVANFGAEIYDISLATFQAYLTTPATAPPNCGNVALDLEPYIIFSTRDYIGQSIADPDNPGDWDCPEGYILDECNGIPSCKTIITVPTLPCGYEFVPCCGGDSMYYQISEGIPLTEGGVYFYSGTFECYTVTSYTGPALALPFEIISITELSEVIDGCNNYLCQSFCLDCTCTRFRWTGTITSGTYPISYIDCDNTLATFNLTRDGVWSEKICLKTVVSVCPNPAICWETESFGDCILSNKASDVQEYACPACYILEDCDGIKDPIYTLNPIIQQYIDQNRVIRIDGLDTCWIPRVSEEDCECAIAVSVQFSYDNCESCKTNKGFKLTECFTGDVIYTTTDLSDYTTVTIEIDCPGCWTVEPVDIIPGAVQPVTVLTQYGTCTECNATYYELTDCAGIKDPIYTSEDLSQLIGQVVQIRFCPDTCWTVSLADVPINPGDVYVDQKFEDCPECFKALFTCSCKKITYVGETPNIKIAYINCDGAVSETALQPGQSTPKTCMLTLATPSNVLLEVTDFGACIDDVELKIYKCPPPPPIGPLRSVKPGYDSPACSPEYYENVMCNYAEWMYKDVLKKRYGISSCCDEELLKWEIKKELLDLDILVNPDYTCAPNNPCNCPTVTSCSCSSCNS